MTDIPVNLNALQERLDELLARAGTDDALRSRLLADPAAAVQAAGIALPPGVALRVHPSGGADGSNGGAPHLTVQAARA